jgi:hypothetical protein
VASDPANPYSLAPALGADPNDRDASTRPRGRGALLVMRGGRVLLAVESRGRRVRVGTGASEVDVLDAAAAIATHLGRRVGARRAKDIVIERIDDAPATTSPHAEAFARAGFKRGTTTLVFYAGV